MFSNVWKIQKVNLKDDMQGNQVSLGPFCHTLFQKHQIAASDSKWESDFIPSETS